MQKQSHTDVSAQIGPSRGEQDVPSATPTLKGGANCINQSRERCAELTNCVPPSVRTCTCKIKIQGKPAVVLIDTGSMVTIVRSSIVGSKDREEGERKVEVVLRSASGHTIPITREADLQFELGGEMKQHRAYICHDLLHDAIVGFDFIQKHEVIIDAANKSLWLQSGRKISLENDKRDPELTSTGLYLAQVEMEFELLEPPGLEYPEETGPVLTADEDSRQPEEDLKGETEAETMKRNTEYETDAAGDGNEDEDCGNPSTLYQPKFYMKTEEDEVKATSGQDGAQESKLEPEDLDTGLLAPEERGDLLRLVKSHMDCFSWNGELGTCELIEHRIELTSEKPIRRPAYQVAHAQRAFIESEVREMLRKGVIEPSVSPYAAGVVLVPKKSGETRFCVDYRGLNQVTKPDHYPLPMAHSEIFDTLGEARIFSCLDCQQGYWQVKVAKEDRPKTAFRCFLGLYQYRKMPMGLRTSPATYQRLMSHVLSGYIGKFCHCFIDDIICFSRTFEEHLEHLELIFKRLESADIKLKPSKCVFAKEKVNYLGHVVSAGELRPDPRNVEKLRDLPTPQTRREVRGLVGLAAYYRCFVKDFSRRAKPLTDLTKKHSVLKWGQEQESAFNDLKNALTEEPVLALPDFSKPFILMTDGSSTGLGAVLGQKHDGDPKERVIGYASRRTTPGEAKFAACELECLALTWAVSHFRTYIWGHKTTIVTDHWALKWLLDLKNPNPRLQRWRMALQEYDLEVIHKPANMLKNADFLSRMYQDRRPGGTDQDEDTEGAEAKREEHCTKLRNGAQASMQTQQIQGPERCSTQKHEGHADSGRDRLHGEKAPLEANLNSPGNEPHSADDHRPDEGGSYVRNDEDERRAGLEQSTDTGQAGTNQYDPEAKQVHAVQTRAQTKEARGQGRPKVQEPGLPTEEEAAKACENTGTSPPTATSPESEHIRPNKNQGAGEARELLKVRQEEDEHCREIRKATTEGGPLPTWTKGGNFRIASDGVLEKVDHDTIGTPIYKPVLPGCEIETAIKDAHGGHLKVAKTLARLREKFFFKNMQAQCAKFINSCMTCQGKDRGPKYKAPLGRLPEPWGAWHTVAVDVLGPLPQTRTGNKYVIVITDYLTRFVLAVATRDQTAETTAEALMNKFLEYGFPARLITDNGPNFRSRLVEQLCSLLQTAHLFTTPYHPQFDGLCERFNRTLTSMLRGFVAEHQRDWDRHLPYVMYAYRTAVQESTRETPFFLMFGRPSREPLDILLRQEGAKEAGQIIPAKSDMVSRMHTAFSEVKAHLQEAHERQKKHHDKTSKQRTFEVGDEVMLLYERVPEGQTKKLSPPWKSGYRVIGKVGPLNYLIEHPNQRGKVLRVHVDRLKAQNPKHVWPTAIKETPEVEETRDPPKTHPRFEDWLRGEQARYRPFPDHWSALGETDTEEETRLAEPGANAGQPSETETPPQPNRSPTGYLRDGGRGYAGQEDRLAGRSRRGAPRSRIIHTPERTRAFEIPIIRRSERIRLRKEQTK